MKNFTVTFSANNIYYQWSETGCVKWFLATNITILMRKTFAFRKIGKQLYYRPLKNKGLLVDKNV